MTNSIHTTPQRPQFSANPLRVACALAITIAFVWGGLLAIGYLSDTPARRSALYEDAKKHCPQPIVVRDRGGVFPLDYEHITKPTDSNYDGMVQLALRPHTKYAFTCSSASSIF